MTHIDNVINLVKKLSGLLEKTRSKNMKAYHKSVKLIRKIIFELNFVVDMFWDPSRKLSDREKILEMCRKALVDLKEILLELNRVKKLEDDIVSQISKIYGYLGMFELLEEILKNIYGEEKDAESLAALADIYLEVGWFGKSLEVIEKLISFGYQFYEPLYNRALILYMVGEDNRSLEALRQLEKKYGLIPQLIGLKIAIAIANGRFDEANELARYR